MSTDVECAAVDAWATKNQLALAVFTTPDCGVCNAIKPKLADLAEHYPRLVIRYVDTTALPAEAARFSVFSVPVLVLFVAGRETVRFSRHFGMGEIEDSVARYDRLLGE